jgi:hypothetical protein
VLNNPINFLISFGKNHSCQITKLILWSGLFFIDWFESVMSFYTPPLNAVAARGLVVVCVVVLPCVSSPSAPPSSFFINTFFFRASGGRMYY